MLDKTIGDTSLARKGFVNSLKIANRLLKVFNETPEHLNITNVSVLGIADLDKVAGEIPLAREGYLSSLALCERQLNIFGETAERLRSITVPIYQLAKLDATAGITAHSQERYLRLLQIERLIQESGETTESPPLQN